MEHIAWVLSDCPKKTGRDKHSSLFSPTTKKKKSFSTYSFEAGFGQDLDDGDSGSDSHLSDTKKFSL
jgi:hypothetical protein